MPDVMRWPQFRKSNVSETEQKVFELVYVLDSNAVISRGLQQFSIEAFSDILRKSEARLLIYLLVFKDNFKAKQRQTESDSRSSTLRLDNDWDIEEN